MPLQRGHTVLVPYAAGTTTVTGALDIVRCRPSAPEHTPPQPDTDTPPTQGA
jgi:hypothetical protein